MGFLRIVLYMALGALLSAYAGWLCKTQLGPYIGSPVLVTLLTAVVGAWIALTVGSLLALSSDGLSARAWVFLLALSPLLWVGVFSGRFRAYVFDGLYARR